MPLHRCSVIGQSSLGRPVAMLPVHLPCSSWAWPSAWWAFVAKVPHPVDTNVVALAAMARPLAAATEPAVPHSAERFHPDRPKTPCSHSGKQRSTCQHPPPQRSHACPLRHYRPGTAAPCARSRRRGRQNMRLPTTGIAKQQHMRHRAVGQQVGKGPHLDSQHHGVVQARLDAVARNDKRPPSSTNATKVSKDAAICRMGGGGFGRPPIGRRFRARHRRSPDRSNTKPSQSSTAVRRLERLPHRTAQWCPVRRPGRKTLQANARLETATKPKTE